MQARQSRGAKPAEEGIVARLSPAEKRMPWRIVPSKQRHPTERTYDLRNDLTGETRVLGLIDHGEACVELRKANGAK